MDLFSVKEILGKRENGAQSSYVRMGSFPVVQRTEWVVLSEHLHALGSRVQPATAAHSALSWAVTHLVECLVKFTLRWCNLAADLGSSAHSLQFHAHCTNDSLHFVLIFSFDINHPFMDAVFFQLIKEQPFYVYRHILPPMDQPWPHLANVYLLESCNVFGQRRSSSHIVDWVPCLYITKCLFFLLFPPAMSIPALWCWEARLHIFVQCLIPLYLQWRAKHDPTMSALCSPEIGRGFEN